VLIKKNLSGAQYSNRSTNSRTCLD
jgi:hypothetical protein